MPDVKIKNYNGEYIAYKDVEKLHLSAADSDELVPFSYGEAVSGVPVPLDLAAGDQTLEAPAGTLVKSAVIQKPETLVAENIRNGVSVAGVKGEFIGDTEEATVELAMADGDQVIRPTAAGKVLTKTTVKKPGTLVPGNIAAGVDIAGVTGTLVKLVSEGKTIDLDFSNGDMVVTPDSGKAFSQVSIPKPANLTPENIREGTDICGVVGSALMDNMVETVILEEKTYDDFSEVQGTGIYAPSFAYEFNFVVGETYHVVWDDEEYVCVAYEVDGLTGIGNAAIAGMGEDTGEPFLMGDNGWVAIATLETDASHVIGVSQKTREDAETATVELDFSNGDMEVTPTAEKFFSKVNIPVPDTLIPENIAEGVNIAGIIGTLVAGGGGNVQIATGKFSETSNTNGATIATVNHNLGVIPDIVFVNTSDNLKVEFLGSAFGISTAFYNALGITGFNKNVWSSNADSSNTSCYGHSDNGIDTQTTGPYIHNATETSFSFGSSGKKLAFYSGYRWFAISGLT